MLLVIAMVAMATVLGMAFLSAQTTTTGVTRNLEDQAVARQIAESGLLVMKQRILASTDWRQGRTQGAWVTNQAFGAGTFSVEIMDEDGNPADGVGDAFTLTVVGRYRDVTHVVKAHVQPFVVQDAGLDVSYFISQTSLSKLSDIDWAGTPVYSEVVPNVNRPQEEGDAAAYPGGPVRYWGSLYKGYIEVPQSGMWTFYTESDDGSALYINGSKVVDNDNNHAWQSRSGTVTLDAGRHDFEVRFYENDVHQGVIAFWEGPGVSKQVIPPGVFTRKASDDSEEEDQGKTKDEKAIAVATDTAVTMWGTSTIDSYVASKGVYSDSNSGSKARVSTNSILPLSVQMGDNAQVKGKVLVKPLLPVLPVVTWGNSRISDGIGWLHDPYYIPFISMPGGAPASSGSISLWAGSMTIDSNKRYSSISMGNNAKLIINGDVTIWCNGSFSAYGQSELVINPGSSLTLYVGSSVSTSGTAALHRDSASPEKFKMYMTGFSSMQLNDDVVMSAHVHNPNGALLMYGRSRFFGRFYGQSLTMSGSPRFHVDTPPVDEEEEAVAEKTTYVFAWDEGL